ncbi:hypothetical protein FOXG_02854 [Fusarium oxysporum f. sp. lycopersici 4287]|uniref:HMA domain-containing protein n=2 Tax=Fusarium oxysporum TaxID=5507 RepID=A0A0J9UGG2_FUSO4|nr:hypothetical protein FOXG_02854 [Fusarium oxysporum f. sp. lycopersici 4287]KNA98518.1 hypothetical protein FOXG_02854 [Fusarium oxysporum f. sp. lycopersici 4287]
MPPTKRKAANALDPSERKRAQNRISQQCLREKNITYIRNLEETIDLLQKVATGSDPQDRYSVLLDAHLKLIAENRKLEDALLRLRKKLLSFGQAANAAADDEVFDSIFRRRDAENPETQQPAPSTELANHETPSALDPSINNQTFQDIQEQTNPQTDIFKDASFLLDLSMAGQEHEALTSSTMQPGDTFIDPAISSLSPRSLLFVPNQLSITSMSIFGSRLLGACRRHLDNLHDSGNNAEMVDKIVKTAVRFSMRCVGLESYAYGVLVLDAESTDFDELLRDLVLHSVIEPANHSVAVNILDIFENQVLRRRQNQKNPPRSYFTDPSWTLFQIGPEVGEWYSSEHDIVEEAIFQELDRQINAVAPSPDDNPVEESQANDIAKFLGLDDFCEWKLSKDFARKYPKLDCSTVKGAQVRILSLDGLTCASCVSDVQGIIKTIPGVLKATVSLGLLRAQVEFNNHLVTEGEIIDAIRSAGYDAHSLPSSDSQSWASLLSMIQEPTNSQQHHVNSCQRDFLVATAASTGINRSYRMDLKSLEIIPILSTSVLGGRLLKTILSQRDRVFASPLSSLVPAMAMVCNKTDEHASIPIGLLSPCDSVIVRQGEHIPCDGVVESTASALILETWINGSLEPRTVKRNDAVYAGGQVQQGSLVCRTTACGGSTRLGELLTSVVTAELANSEPQLHRATSWFSSAVILLAITLLTVYPVLANETCWIDGLGRASALLLAACPCSLSLSIPTCKLLATVEASKFGVRLLTTYARLRSAASAQTIFFDKTGTLTHGDLKVIHASFSKEWETLEKQEILWRAVHEVEAGITHPVAQALFQESYSKLGQKPGYLSTILVSGIKYELGRGAQAVVTATQPGSGSTTWKLAIGSRTYIESPGVSVDLSQTPVKMRTGVTTTVVLAMDGKQAAVFALEDTVRSDAQKVISQLKDLGLTIGMITGDNAASAISVARELGIDSDMIFANALPEEKSCILARFLQRGPAIYVGDNYNDLLCFASASFGICVASSEMQSIDSDCADGTLMISEASPLSRIPLVILLARPCVLGVGWIPPPSPLGFGERTGEGMP